MLYVEDLNFKPEPLRYTLNAEVLAIGLAYFFGKTYNSGLKTEQICCRGSNWLGVLGVSRYERLQNDRAGLFNGCIHRSTDQNFAIETINEFYQPMLDITPHVFFSSLREPEFFCCQTEMGFRFVGSFFVRAQENKNTVIYRWQGRKKPSENNTPYLFACSGNKLRELMVRIKKILEQPNIDEKSIEKLENLKLKIRRIYMARPNPVEVASKYKKYDQILSEYEPPAVANDKNFPSKSNYSNNKS
ncbi:unnamed protein product [marine sediment metagenome]|uniref:Uncharacterized protein n=1 Tax=marine sediment metagenome TaxID=412755 RepID=X0ZK07_9ZZZZ